eukprot:g7547.t1
MVFCLRPILPPPRIRDKRYKTFLALDGGGIKGLISAMVLQQLVDLIKIHFLTRPEYLPVYSQIETYKDFHIDLADYFNGIAGISAGSWIAAYLVSKGGNGASKDIFSLAHIVSKYGHIRPGSVDGLEVFFMEYGRDIYPPNVNPITLKFRWTGFPTAGIEQVTVPKYTASGLEWVLKRFLGDTKLSEVHTSFMVTGFDLQQRSSLQFIADHSDWYNRKIYTNIFYTRGSPRDTSGGKWRPDLSRNEGLDYFIRDLVRGSSAFPMIHPSKEIKPLRDISSAFDVIDGAMVGNNPTLQQVVWAMSEMNTTLDDAAFLSIGTGTTTGSHSYLGEKGAMQWLAPMIELLLGATPEYLASCIDLLFYEVVRAKPNQYLRIQATAEENTELGAVYGTIDNVQLLPDMKEAGYFLGLRFKDHLQEFVKTFMFED